MVEDGLVGRGEAVDEGPAGSVGVSGGLSERELRRQVRSQLRDVSFPVAVRGYSRAEVDAYVGSVNQLIAELEVSRSPRAAVQHALDRVEGQMAAILERARETAEEITASARAEAEKNSAHAGAEAASLLVNANDEAERSRVEAEEVRAKAQAEAEALLIRARSEADELLARSRSEADERRARSEKELSVRQELAETRMRELQADTDALWEQRRELLDDLRGLAAQLKTVADEAATRLLPPSDPGRDEAETPVSAGRPAASEPRPPAKEQTEGLSGAADGAPAATDPTADAGTDPTPDANTGLATTGSR